MYTGILLRKGSYAELKASNPLVDRELAICELGLAVGLDKGQGIVTKFLNLEALASIGRILSDGSVTEGIKTSNIPILFDDSAGELFVNDTNLIVRGSKLPLSLRFIKSVSSSTIVFTDNGSPETLTSVSISALKTFAMKPPEIFNITNSQASVIFDNSEGKVAFLEDSSGLTIGSSTSSNSPIVYSGLQASGQKIYGYIMDSHKNKSYRTSVLIP